MAGPSAGAPRQDQSDGSAHTPVTSLRSAEPPMKTNLALDELLFTGWATELLQHLINRRRVVQK